MVVRERMMRVTSKHFFSRRGFSLFVYSLVRLVGKPVERVEPHDLWIRTALHRSTYVLQRRRRDPRLFPAVTRLDRLPTISTSRQHCQRCYRVSRVQMCSIILVHRSANNTGIRPAQEFVTTKFVIMNIIV